MAIDINLKKVKRGALITIITLTVIAIASLLIYANFTYSEGARNGTVVKLSKKGVMFKTWEGQLNVGAFIPGDSDNASAPSNVWAFSVPSSNSDVLSQIDKSIEVGKRVKLHYKEKLISLPWRGDTKYLIYDVEILE